MAGLSRHNERYYNIGTGYKWRVAGNRNIWKPKKKGSDNN